MIVVTTGTRCKAISCGDPAGGPPRGGSGDRHPEEAFVVVSGMLGGGQPRRIGQAEQAGRMRALVHLAQLDDRDVCERIWTVIQTCAQQDRSVFEFLCAAVTAYFRSGEAPSLLPDTS